MQEENVRAIFLLAGIRVIFLEKVANRYRGLDKPTAEYWWWAVETRFGKVVIGWRKNVIHIDWEDTGMVINVTEDNVTKSGRSVHAWSELKALEYLITWNAEASKRIKEALT